MAQVIFAFLLLTLVCPAASSTDPSEFVSLLQTRAHVVASDEAVTLDLSTVKHNNLGGFGPDSGTAEVRYGPVATLNDGTQVFLKVSRLNLPILSIAKIATFIITILLHCPRRLDSPFSVVEVMLYRISWFTRLAGLLELICLNQAGF